MSNSYQKAPVGHWPLTGHCDSIVPSKLSITPPKAMRFDGAALFDGKSTALLVNGVSKSFGKDGFSLSVHIHIEPNDASGIGDIASKFTPATRTGFNLSVADHGGVTSASSNYRNLNFSVDADTTPHWEDCGRPGNARHICALTVCNGDLYAATFEHGDGEIGHVFKYKGNRRWEDTGLPCSANCAFGLAAIDGVLYATSGRYDPRNSALPDTGNMDEQTRVWRLTPSKAWEDIGSPPAAEDDLYNVGIYRGKLYATGSFHRGLYRYDDEHGWRACSFPYPRFFSLSQWRDELYAASNKSLRTLGPRPEREIFFQSLPDADGAYAYNDRNDVWRGTGEIPVETQMYGFCVHRGALHTGSWPTCKVFRSACGTGWTDIGALHPDEKEVMAMCVYNGMMYAGTLPAADIYRYDGDHEWTRVGNVDATTGVKYRRAWSMAVHDGQLFVGALPSGHVHAMRTGAVASDSHQLTAGWHHVAATFDGRISRLYVDGKLRSEAQSAQPLDIANDAPLLIGLGAHDYFKGKMKDLRLYDGPLAEGDITHLAQNRS